MAVNMFTVELSKGYSKIKYLNYVYINFSDTASKIHHNSPKYWDGRTLANSMYETWPNIDG